MTVHRGATGGPFMELSPACGCPGASALLRVCGSNIPVISASVGRESLSDGGVPGRGGIDPVSPHCSMCYSADVDLQQTDGPYVL